MRGPGVCASLEEAAGPKSAVATVEGLIMRDGGPWTSELDVSVDPAQH